LGVPCKIIAHLRETFEKALSFFCLFVLPRGIVVSVFFVSLFVQECLQHSSVCWARDHDQLLYEYCNWHLVGWFVLITLNNKLTFRINSLAYWCRLRPKRIFLRTLSRKIFVSGLRSDVNNLMTLIRFQSRKRKVSFVWVNNSSIISLRG
jgi:hypothetical protein